jgi:3-oxo-4,17-pregnadiene-20-carboxyl-CoA hydratase alpha subunit
VLKPIPGEDDRFYFDGWQEEELRIQRCSDCSQLRHPPGPSCPSCLSPRWEAVRASGAGEVYSYVIPRKPSLEGMLPSPVIALVQLDEGVRIVANLVEVEPADVRFGQRVELLFREIEPGFRIPLFRPAR